MTQLCSPKSTETKGQWLKFFEIVPKDPIIKGIKITSQQILFNSHFRPWYVFVHLFSFSFSTTRLSKRHDNVLNIAVSSTFFFPPQELQYMVWNSPWSYLFESYPKELFTFIIIIIIIMMIVVIIIIIIIIRACNVNSPLIEGKRTRLPASHLS